MKILDNKIIVITGGSGLLGSDFVKNVVEHGGTAIIGDVQEAAALQLINQIKKQFSDACIDYVYLDITKKQTIQQAIHYLSNRYGAIDGLVNNAYPRNKNYGCSVMEVAFDDFL